MKQTRGEKIFGVFNAVLMILLAVACVLPVWHVVMASISDPYAVETSKSFLLLPVGEIQFKAYDIILSYQGLWNGYKNTIFYVICQCVLAVICSCVGGYIMSRKGLRYKGVFTLLLLIPMMFNGGMVPTFAVMQALKLLDNPLIMILPGSLNVLYFIFMRLAIESVPAELEECARLDGAGELRILVQIILPLCKATIAVVVLFTAIAKWNDYMSGLVYLPTRVDLYPLQMHIRNILNNANNITNAAQAVENANAYSRLVQYAVIVVTTAPILCIYPFVQKYFVKGVTLGSVKG